MVSFNHITNIISEMLYKHDCVIIPHFGGFVARNHSASFSKSLDVIIPPSKQILFNRNLIHNDGLLVNAISEKHNLSYQYALKLLEDYKDYIVSLLGVKKRFELTNLGLLYIDTEQILRFEQKADVNFLIDSFGFEPVIAQPIPVQTEPKIIAADTFIDRKIVAEPVVKPKKTKSYLRMAAITISAPLVFASLFFALSSKRLQPLMESSVNPFYTPEKVYQPKSEFKPNTAKIDIAKTETPVETDNGLMYFKLENTDKIIIASATDNKLTPPKADIKLKINTEVQNFSSDAPFQVVVGCFSVEENANRLIRDLQKNNISAAISGVNTKGLHVVSCGGFTSKDQAVNKLEEIKEIFPSAWIMAK